jgi:hypothetical protein
MSSFHDQVLIAINDKLSGEFTLYEAAQAASYSGIHLTETQIAVMLGTLAELVDAGKITRDGLNYIYKLV